MNKFHYGDKVKLKSDINTNTPMTVNGYQNEDYKEAITLTLLDDSINNFVSCVWRDKNDMPRHEYYHEDCLILIE